jgi:hypothetical protein
MMQQPYDFKTGKAVKSSMLISLDLPHPPAAGLQVLAADEYSNTRGILRSNRVSRGSDKDDLHHQNLYFSVSLFIRFANRYRVSAT